MIVSFLIFLFVLFYIYFLYPLVLSIRPKNKATFEPNRKGYFPFVSIIIAAYNEEKHIAKKLQNALDQNYSSNRCEILVTSDGCTDKTVQIVKSFNNFRVKVIENTKRSGKNVALNTASHNAKGDILVFTDANALFVKDAVTKLIAHFEDDEVGLVCGHLKYLKGSTNNVGQGEGLYFRYESLIKRLESRWGSLAVVTGSIYAIRKSLFVPLDGDVANDFAHPVQVGAKGYNIIFEPEAVAYEQATSSTLEEFKRRARIVTRGYTAFGRYWKKYRMLRGMRGFCYVSHKLLRWLAPFFLLGLLVTNFFLDLTPFKIIFFLQVSFYVAAVLGLFFKGKWGKPFVIPFYFCMINLAALMGFINYIRGTRQSVWEVAGTTR